MVTKVYAIDCFSCKEQYPSTHCKLTRGCDTCLVIGRTICYTCAQHYKCMIRECDNIVCPCRNHKFCHSHLTII